MLDVRYSHLYFYQSLNRLQRGLSAIAELLVFVSVAIIDILRMREAHWGRNAAFNLMKR